MSKVKKNHGHHLKFNPAEQRENFFKRLKNFCYVVAGPGAYEMIPRDDLDILFMSRFLPFRIVPAPNERIPDSTLKSMRHLLPLLMKSCDIPVTKGGTTVPMGEAVTTGSTLKFYLDDLKDEEYVNARKVKETFEPFTSFEEGTRMANERFDLYLNVLGFESSDLDSCMYWVEFKPCSRGVGRWGVDNRILVHSHVPEEIKVTFDGATRPAVRACVALATGERGIVRISMGAGKLGLDGEQEKRFGVYIQRHALKRLRERLDCLDTFKIQSDLAISLMEPVVLRRDGRFLIEYRIDSVKAGYLLADLTDGLVVVRTFLFVTNSGTPEGKKLQELSGLGRLDREFMAIDKLSTFIKADLKSDKQLEALFREAGCGSLVDLHDTVNRFADAERDPSALQFLMKYFGVGGKHDFLMPDPLERWQNKVSWEEPRPTNAGHSEARCGGPKSTPA